MLEEAHPRSPRNPAARHTLEMLIIWGETGGYSNVCIKGLCEYYAALSDGVIDGVHSLMFHELITGVSSREIGRCRRRISTSSKFHLWMILWVIYGEVTEPPSITASARCHLAAFVLLFTRDDVCVCVCGGGGGCHVQAWRKGRGGGGEIKTSWNFSNISRMPTQSCAGADRTGSD